MAYLGINGHRLFIVTPGSVQVSKGERDVTEVIQFIGYAQFISDVPVDAQGLFVSALGGNRIAFVLFQNSFIVDALRQPASISGLGENLFCLTRRCGSLIASSKVSECPRLIDACLGQ